MIQSALKFINQKPYQTSAEWCVFSRHEHFVSTKVSAETHQPVKGIHRLKEARTSVWFCLKQLFKLLLLLRHQPRCEWVEIRFTVRSVSLCIWIYGDSLVQVCSLLLLLAPTAIPWFPSGLALVILQRLQWTPAYTSRLSKCWRTLIKLKSGCRNTSLHWCRWGLLRPCSSTTTLKLACGARDLLLPQVVALRYLRFGKHWLQVNIAFLHTDQVIPNSLKIVSWPGLLLAFLICMLFSGQYL